MCVCVIAFLITVTILFFPRPFLKPMQEVCNQLWKTLFDYPCLRNCPSLVDFVRHCTRLTWSLLVQRSRFTLDIETKVFREEWHSRLHEADNNSDTIRSYQWPTLFEEGICVVKGMVIT